MIRASSSNFNQNTVRPEKTKQAFPGSTTKMRKHLPLVDSYNRDIEFPADGPGRVIVRLERLMGSDKIRITDTKYMSLLLQRLQEEEEKTMQRRSRDRRKAEHNRYRQLVIDGYTDPGPDMEDLFHHPVFRVNRILNRLSKLGLHANPNINLPKIIPLDPFKHDDTGKVFKSFPGHLSLIQGVDYYSDSDNTEDEIDIIEQIMYVHADGDAINSDERKDTSTSQTESDARPETTEEKVLTMKEIQKLYGVALNTDLAAQWSPYKDQLTNSIFVDKDRDMWDLYQSGVNIVSVFERQQQTTDEYISAVRGHGEKTFFRNKQNIYKKAFKKNGETEEKEDWGEESDQESDLLPVILSKSKTKSRFLGKTSATKVPPKEQQSSISIEVTPAVTEENE